MCRHQTLSTADKRVKASYVELQKRQNTYRYSPDFQNYHQRQRTRLCQPDCRCSRCTSKLISQKATGITREHRQNTNSECSMLQTLPLYLHAIVVKVWNSIGRHTAQARIINQLKSCLRRDLERLFRPI